jgi:DNA mismatch endonuclease (patch repair protein)
VPRRFAEAMEEPKRTRIPAVPLEAPPPPSSKQARVRMVRQPRRDTAPEVALRSALHAAGFRYRVDVRPLPGLRRTADIVFRRKRVAVFVDGCFWHQCPIHSRPSKANTAWWQAKLARNRARDAETDEVLAEHGWKVIRVWEHEDPRVAARGIADVVNAS